MKVIGELGQGGFGKVEEVVNESGHRFARKTFVPPKGLPPEMLTQLLRRFEREIGTQKNLEHRNIVQIIDADLSSNPPSYLMPIAVASLADDIAEDHQLGGNQFSAIRDIVLGLEYMHGMDFFHRDLKPQNILRFIDENNDHFYALSDFGLVATNETGITSLTATGMGKGTDHYTAPEMTTNMRQAGVASDIYSLGCIIHDLFGTDERVPFHQINESGPFSALLRGCTRDNPEDRFKSASTVLDVLWTIDQEEVSDRSVEHQRLIDVMSNREEAYPEFWSDVLDVLQSSASFKDKLELCRNMDLQSIVTLCETELVKANAVGEQFGQIIRDRQFSFDFCDVLANRLEAFVINCELTTKAECLLAMLRIGTSHNRWYVEEKFVNHCSPDMDDGLANLMAVEFLRIDKAICDQISHLERSISFDRRNFHPKITEALQRICN